LRSDVPPVTQAGLKQELQTFAQEALQAQADRIIAELAQIIKQSPSKAAQEPQEPQSLVGTAIKSVGTLAAGAGKPASMPHHVAKERPLGHGPKHGTKLERAHSAETMRHRTTHWAASIPGIPMAFSSPKRAEHSRALPSGIASVWQEAQAGVHNHHLRRAVYGHLLQGEDEDESVAADLLTAQEGGLEGRLVRPASIRLQAASWYLTRSRSPCCDSLARCGRAVCGGCLDAVRDTRQRLLAVVLSHAFEYFMAIMIVLNTAALGLRISHSARHDNPREGRLLRFSEAFFCAVFLAEVTLNLCAFGFKFFTAKGMWQWNLFDLVIVVTQVMELILLHCFSDPHVKGKHPHTDFSFMRMLRIARLMRITRLIRVVRFLEELRTLFSSIFTSMRSLLWSLLLLFMVLYCAGILFCQLVTDVLKENLIPQKERESLEYWFGSFERTLLTMMETVLGGVSWDDVVNPLLISVGPITAMTFCFFVAFTMLAVLNVVTGIFVEQAMNVAAHDKDMYATNHICDLFFNDDTATHISWEVFKTKVNTPDMKEYFKAINVDISEAHGLFNLIDVQQKGVVDSAQIVDGLIRLRGNAKALELGLLMAELADFRKNFFQHQITLETELHTMKKFLAKAVLGDDVDDLPVLSDSVLTMRERYHQDDMALSPLPPERIPDGIRLM